MSILHGTVALRIRALRADWQKLVIAPGLFGLGLIATFLGQLLLGWTASPYDFGLYILIYNAAAVLSAFGAVGFDLSAVRFAALASSRQDGEYLSRFNDLALRWSGLAGVASGLAMMLYLMVSEIVSFEVLAIAAAITFFWSLSRVVAGVMRGTGLLASALLSDRVTRDVFVLGLAVTASLTAMVLSASLAMFTLLAGTVFGFSVGIWFCARRVRGLKSQRSADLVVVDSVVRRDWILVSLGLMAYNISELFSSRFDIFSLSLFDSKEAVGALGLALLLINLVTIPSAFLALLVMPQVAVAYECRDLVRLRRLFRLTSFASIGFGAMIATAIVLLLPFTSAFLPPALWVELRWDVLCGAIFVRSLCLVGSFPPILLMMSGRHKALIGAHLTSIAVRCAIYGLCASIVDTNLAIIAFVSGAVVVTTLNLCQVRRQLNGDDDGLAGGKAAEKLQGA